jgi:hypothetical protein
MVCHQDGATIDRHIRAKKHVREVEPVLVAAGIGLLIGIERERRKGIGEARGAAGLRTFVLVALLGALTARAGEPEVIAAGVLVVGAAALASYRRVEDPGLTTEFALIVTFLLGVLALTEQELRDALLIAAAALILLPIVPDRPLGPGDALNPYTVWRRVVVIMVIGALARVAVRALGPRRGIPLAGFAGGFVSAHGHGRLRWRLARGATRVRRPRRSLAPWQPRRQPSCSMSS